MAFTGNLNMLMAFLYIDKEIHAFSTMEKAMNKAINLLVEKV